jgi:hypothetical protein
MPKIPASKEAKTGKITVQGKPKVNKTPHLNQSLGMATWEALGRRIVI